MGIEATAFAQFHLALLCFALNVVVRAGRIELLLLEYSVEHLIEYSAGCASYGTSGGHPSHYRLFLRRHAEFGEDQTNRFRIIAYFRFSKWRPSVILYLVGYSGPHTICV